MTDLVNINVQVPKDLRAAFELCAAELDLDMSKAGRRAFMDYLEKHGKAKGGKVDTEFQQLANEHAEERKKMKKKNRLNHA